METHLYTHDSKIGIKEEKYDICSNTFKGLNSLKIHKDTTHEDPLSVKDTCENLNDISVKQEVDCDPLKIDSQLIEFKADIK